jgi:hypothetical protein
MQLRERQYQSRLARSARTTRSGQHFSITNRNSRPPLQVWKTVVRWLPVVIALAIIWYLLDTFVF